MSSTGQNLAILSRYNYANLGCVFLENPKMDSWIQKRILRFFGEIQKTYYESKISKLAEDTLDQIYMPIFQIRDPSVFFLWKDSQKVYLASFFPVISLLERIARNSELKEGSAPHVFPPTLSEITNPFSDSPIKNTPLARERDCHLTIWSTYRNRMQIIPRALTSSSDISPVVCCFVADVNQICENEKRTCGACRPLKSLLFTH